MPLEQRQAIMVIAAVSFAIPLQHFLTDWENVSLAGSARSAIHRLERLIDWLEDVADGVARDAGEEGDTAFQVGLASGAKDNSSEAHFFATSPKPRRRRPSEVLYRVGQIVFHRQLEVRGVVMGWDEVAVAPLHWLKQVYGVTNTEIYEEPHYTVICDQRQVPSVENEVHYFAQSQLDNDGSGGAVSNPLLEKVFKGFNAEKGQYILSPQQMKLYPRDSL